MSTTELLKKIKELRELQALIDEAQAEAETLRDEIKAYMGEEEELRVGEYKITWRTVRTARIDTTALKAAHPDIAFQFTRPFTTRRFTIT